MAIRMINPAEANQKQDYNPVKLGLDQKQNVTISLNESTAKRLGLIVKEGEESPLLQVGVDGTKLYLIPAGEGQTGFELSKTKGELPRYQFSLHRSSLFDAEALAEDGQQFAETFRARIMSYVQNEEIEGVNALSIDVKDSLIIDTPVDPEPSGEPVKATEAPKTDPEVSGAIDQDAEEIELPQTDTSSTLDGQTVEVETGIF
jgi:hypothetical protein